MQELWIINFALWIGQFTNKDTKTINKASYIQIASAKTTWKKTCFRYKMKSLSVADFYEQMVAYLMAHSVFSILYSGEKCHLQCNVDTKSFWSYQFNKSEIFFE